MIRTQVQLTDGQVRGLKEVAAAQGVSMAEVIRVAVDRHLGSPATGSLKWRAIERIGGFRSGRRDVGTEHDKYLADAFVE